MTLVYFLVGKMFLKSRVINLTLLFQVFLFRAISDNFFSDFQRFRSDFFREIVVSENWQKWLKLLKDQLRKKGFPKNIKAPGGNMLISQM